MDTEALWVIHPSVRGCLSSTFSFFKLFSYYFVILTHLLIIQQHLPVLVGPLVRLLTSWFIGD